MDKDCEISGSHGGECENVLWNVAQYILLKLTEFQRLLPPQWSVSDDKIALLITNLLSKF